ncbi:TPR and ankyrin repeat-containing protein 1-like [Liolophura sinensis]|uniref:TPR and ankyrin repeat-containing protein 1-like n=1 Tax=Liolophura sinensis TaxID=3198878 RepID=UPI00315982A0
MLHGVTQGQRVDCLVEIAQLATKVKDNNMVERIQASAGEWKKVLKRLSLHNKWESVRMLMGLSAVSYSTLNGVAKGCKADGINVGALLNSLSEQALNSWGEKLAVVLLKEGADLKTVWMKKDDLPLLAALTVGLRCGSFQLLKYLLERLHADFEAKNGVDGNGDSAYHIVVKSGKANTTVGETAVRLLLNNGCRCDIRDKAGKLPVEYLNPTDQVYSLLQRKCFQPRGHYPHLPDPGDLRGRLEELREIGKTCMKNRAYANALSKYSEGIKLAGNSGDLKQDVAILYSNRSAVYTKLGNLKAALKDAETCILNNPFWPKGYWRKGRVLKSQGRYKDAFLTYLEGFECDKHPEGSELCLVEAVTVMSLIKDYKPFLEMLGRVAKPIISSVIKRLAKQADWWVLSLLIVGGAKSLTKAAQGGTAEEVNLHELVSLVESKPSSVCWPFNLLLSLMFMGASPDTMVSQKGDTTYHAALRLALHMEDLTILEIVVKTRKRQEVAKCVVNGNKENLLHALAKSPKKNYQIGQSAADLLIRLGVDRHQRDEQGKTPTDYLPADSKLAPMFGKTTAVKNDTTQKEPSQKAKKKPPVRSRPADPCDRCVSHLTACRSLHQKGDSVAAIESACKVVCEKWHSSDRHKKLRGESVEEILTILDHSFRPEIPVCMLDLPQETYRGLIKQLAIRNRWLVVERLVSKWRDKQPGNKDMAVGLCVGDVIRCDQLQSNALYRTEVIRILLDNGAFLPATPEITDEPISIALERKYFRIIPVLLQHGAQPKRVRLTHGDTPLHAALKVALELDKGNFDLLERLLEMYDQDQEKYPYLDPRSLDKTGSSLYHMAAKCRYSCHAQRAVELLCARRLPAGGKDSSGRVPLDYISKQNDRRREYLRMAAGYSLPSKKATSTPMPSSSSEQSMDPSGEPFCPSPTAEKGKEMPENSAQIKLRKSKKSEKERCKAALKKWIGELSDFVFQEEDDDSFKDKVAERTGLGKGGDETETKRALSSVTPDESGDGLHIVEDIEQGLEDLDGEDVVQQDDASDEINADIFDDLDWEVECTADVWKFLKNKRMPMFMKQRAIKRIQKLARGEWTDSLTKIVHNVPDTLNLFEAKISKGARILWERAIAFSPKLSEKNSTQADIPVEEQAQIYTEVIRVWDIVVLHDNLYHRIQQIARSHARGRDSILLQKLVRISTQQTTVRDNINYCMPELFMLSEKNTEQALTFYPPASPSEREYHIVKFYSFSAALVNHILHQTDTKVDFPFKVTDMEHAIISLQLGAPVLLLGRSGTGKTTCCLYRLWHAYLRYWTQASQTGDPLLPRSAHFTRCKTPVTDGEESSEEEESDDEDLEEEEDDTSECEKEEGPEREDEEAPEGEVHILDHLQQVFVTKNGVLCNEVMKNFQDLNHACSLTNKRAEGEDRALPNRLQDIPNHNYPLFLTSQQLLLLLDASLPSNPFFEREEDGSLKRDIRGWTDADSPLAVLSDLDSDSEGEEDEVVGGAVGSPNAHSTQHLDPRQEVTYQVFAEELWPKIKIKGYHPSLIWTEINSFLKGSFEALRSSSGKLTLEEYQELGRKRATNFTGERAKVYTVFKRYEVLKRQRGLFDECDFLLNIYRRLCKTEKQNWVFHQVYVDETQDFTQAELCLLIGLCQNPNEMFFTGDTAQGIMCGISFRFSDLKSLFFYASRSLRAMGKHQAVKVPEKVYQLTHNYRSHAGILTLASSVVDLMVEFFPETFDQLGRDQGLFSGPLPVLLESCSFCDLAVLLRGNRRQTSEIEFGAHQAILVVNDAAREALPEELRLGVVLTIFEAKGLEFDDILLYNFFKDSQAKKEWRVVTEFLHRLSGDETENPSRTASSHGVMEIDTELMSASSSRPLSFNPDQHKVLCSELKHLYTALTRARVNVWIFDEDAENRAPMFDYFKARRLVRAISARENQSEGLTDEMFAESSSSADWLKRGDDFMKHRLYEVAAKCYRKANVEDKENIALAHAAALKATRLQENPARMREEFLYAAEQYLIKCDMKAEAARCLKNAKERELAARLYDKMGEMEKAGGLYKMCNLNYEASRCYEQQGLYRQAISTLCEMNSYDMAIDVLNRYNMRLKDYNSKGKPLPKALAENRPEQTMDRLTYKAAEFHRKKGDEQRMLRSLERLRSPEDRINFLMKHGRPLLAVNVLKELGLYSRAASILFEEGQYDEAMKFAEMAKDDGVVNQCLLASCRKKIVDKDLTSTLPGDNQIKEKESVVMNLKQLITYFTFTRDTSTVAEIHLLLGQLNWDESMVRESWWKFGKLTPTPNEAGQVECSKALLTMVSLKDDSKACYEFAKNHLLRLLMAFKASYRPSNNQEREKVRLYRRYYGLKSAKIGYLEYYPKHYPNCRLFLREDREKSRIDIKVEDANSQFQAYLLKLVELWVLEIRSSVELILSENQQCPKFLSGEGCQESATCHYLHKPHSKETFLNLFHCHLSQAHICAEILRTCQVVTDESLRHELLKLLPLRNEHASLDDLIHFILPNTTHWKHFCSDGQLLTYVFSSLSHQDLRHTVDRWQNEMWSSLKYKEKISTTSVYVEVCICSAIFLNKMNKVDAWMKEAEKAASFKANQKTDMERSLSQGAAMIGDKYKGQSCFICYARRFFEALNLVYRPQPEPVEALLKFGKFLAMLRNKGDTKVFPHYGQLLFSMEFFLMLDFSLGAKHMGQYLIVPASYISVVRFMDQCFAKQKCQSLFNVVKSSKLNKRHQILLDKISTMVDILIGKETKGKGQGFSLLKDMLQPSSPHIESGIAERGMIFLLTLLSNVSGMVLEDHQSDLLQAVHNPLPVQTKLPQRLLSVISRTRKSVGQKDIVKTLRDALREKNDEDLLVCRWVVDAKKKESLSLEIVEESTVWDELPSEFGTGQWQENTYNFSDLKVKEPTEDEGLGMSPEEMEKQMEEERKEKAARVLLKFFKFVRFKMRAQMVSVFLQAYLGNHVSNPRFPAYLQEIFQRCTVDETSDTNDAYWIGRSPRQGSGLPGSL